MNRFVLEDEDIIILGEKETVKNGGKGSGNFGHSGRPGEVGGSGNGKTPDTPMKSMTYTEQGENGPQLIKETLAYLRGNHPEIYNEQAIDKNSGFRWRDKEKESYVDKEEFLTAVVNGEGDAYKEGDVYLRQLSDAFRDTYYKDSEGNEQEGYGSKFLYGLLQYTIFGAHAYGREKGGRKEFDENYGISEFIDKNADVHYTSNKPLYRGLTTNKTRVKALKVGAGVDMEGVSSWTESEKISQRFLDSSLVKNGTVKVMFRDITKGERNAMINPFSSSDATSYVYNNQLEVVYSGSSKFKIKNVKPETLRHIGGDEIIYHVDVESE